LPKFDTGWNFDASKDLGLNPLNGLGQYGVFNNIDKGIQNAKNYLTNPQNAKLPNSVFTNAGFQLGANKRILNGSTAKQSSTEGGSGSADIGGIAMGALNFGGSILNAFGQPVKTQQELLADAGESSQSVMGIGYQA
jgi:hypothetical protein